MKKCIALCLALLLALTLAGILTACTERDPAEAESTRKEPTNTEETVAADPESSRDQPADTDPETSEDTAEDTDAVETDATTETAEAETDASVEEDAAGGDYKYVVIVGVDGAGQFFRDANTPFMDVIFANGAVTYEAITSTPSISAQSWGSLLHGVTPEFHGLNNTVAAAQPYPSDSEFPSVFRVIREQMPEAALASFCNWGPVNVGIIEEGLGVHKVNIGGDANVIRQASNYVRNARGEGREIPTLLFLQLDEADGAGHGSGYGTQTHLDKLEELDGYIQLLYQTYVNLGIIEDTLFIVTTDHGGLGTSHGGSSDVEMQITFAAAGKTVQKGTIGEMGIRDTASIVLYALGLADAQPTSWTSRVPSGLFEGVEAGERPVYEWPVGTRTHENVPTPEEGSEGHISHFITDKQLITYLTFDGDITDECGTATTSDGKLYFEEGYFGQGVALNDGYVSIPNYAPATDSFSVTLWIKTPGVSSDPSIFSNKDWDNGSKPGYVFSLRSNDVKFNAGDGVNRVDYTVSLPHDFRGGWMHVALVVDRAAGEVRIALDFGRFHTFALSESMLEASFDAYDVLNIGQDGTGSYSSSLPATVDEFMIFDGALTDGELAELAEYYGK